MPRVETTRTLAATLGPPPRRGSGELGWGVAHRHAAGDAAARRPALGCRLVAARPARLRAERGPCGRDRASADGRCGGRRPRGSSRLVGRGAGACCSRPRGRAAPSVCSPWWRSNGPRHRRRRPPIACSALRPVGLDRGHGRRPGSARRRAARQGAGAGACGIDTDVDLAEPFRDLPAGPAPAFFICDGFEDEAAAAAAQVLVHVERGETPVALIAQDRVLVRRVRALLERDAVVLRDETGWKLATTRAGAAVMAPLLARACATPAPMPGSTG